MPQEPKLSTILLAKVEYQKLLLKKSKKRKRSKRNLSQCQSKRQHPR